MLRIGRFSLYHGNSDKITIFTEDGEGGDFDERKLAELLEAFYAREF